ncbi:glycoside hydrolase family 44 protein [Cytophaga aurantiaca]|uniref:glycoside hydrolase family 44 protein n=1 Tax=Cytophaga aurantiaca TaxID=29530 RepID=UPI0003829B41|nr:glycoside hydrolase family 44 protein [Cytophaga aurantiaca]
MKILYTSLFLFANLFFVVAQTTITIDPTANQHKISPWIYGRNNNLSDDPSNPTTSSQWQLYRDAGLRMYRENGGNNSTKYNWKAKLTSHPDWYNNVYAHDWDYTATSLLNNSANTQGLFAFQLLGKAASNKQHNFNDWVYTQANGSINTSANWAGGGGPVAYGGNGGNGNPNLYLENWTADSTAKILDHWFNTLGYDKSRFTYWNMDNEPEIWSGTHDDIATSAITAELYMQKYFAVAKAVRAKFPNIKLVGPVSTNEWQWYNWNNSKVTDPHDGNEYPWMQYFIKRIAEEEAASGIRLLDVLDVHFYPGTENDPSTTLQLHRVWFDDQYVYPKANGVKVTGQYGWDNNITKEYFFKRCDQWLTQYKGANHNVTFSLSEYGAIANGGSEDANVIACWYASHLGVFTENKVELFTPWDWYKGQWEVLHLFSKYFGEVSVKSTSTNNNTISGYSSLTADGDSLIIVVVNRDQSNTQPVVLNLQNFVASAGTVSGYRLSDLPSTETFVSKTTNALQNLTFTVSSNSVSFMAPALSVTMIQIPTNQPVSIDANITTAVKPAVIQGNVTLYPNPAKNILQINVDNGLPYEVLVQNMLGQTVATTKFTGDGQIDLSGYAAGQYILQISNGETITVKKFIKE